METIVLVVHVLAALGVIGLVLLQHGKGADMGAAFGSGASGSLFGVTGASNFLSRSTAVLVALFFFTSLSLTYISGHKSKSSSVIQIPQKALAVPKAPDPSNKSVTDLAPSKAKDIPQ